MIKVKKILLVLVIIVIYLSIAYGYFYNFLGRKHLLPPPHQTKITMGNDSRLRTIKYLALGDSLTEGVGLIDYKTSYPYLVAQKLSASNNVELTNMSRAGATSTDVLTQQLTQLPSLKPDLITLLIGVNDVHNRKSLTEFENNYTQIVTILKKSGAKVYLLSIPYLGSNKIVFFPYHYILDFRTRQFNNIIKKISVNFEVQYVDLYSLSKSANFYSIDEFHPSVEGYKKWSEAINVN